MVHICGKPSMRAYLLKGIIVKSADHMQFMFVDMGSWIPASVTISPVLSCLQGDVALSSYLFSESIKMITREKIHSVVGPASSAVTEVIAYVAGKRYQLHQVRKNAEIKV